MPYLSKGVLIGDLTTLGPDGPIGVGFGPAVQSKSATWGLGLVVE